MLNRNQLYNELKKAKNELNKSRNDKLKEKVDYQKDEIKKLEKDKSINILKSDIQNLENKNYKIIL